MLCTITEMKRRNKAAGKYFFNRSAMIFFKSKIHTAPDNNGYFITSEQFVGSLGADPRRFTIRRFDLTTGEVYTVGEFQAHASMEAAKLAKRLLAKS